MKLATRFSLTLKCVYTWNQLQRMQSPALFSGLIKGKSTGLVRRVAEEENTSHWMKFTRNSVFMNWLYFYYISIHYFLCNRRSLKSFTHLRTVFVKEKNPCKTHSKTEKKKKERGNKKKERKKQKMKSTRILLYCFIWITIETFFWLCW